MAITVTFDPPLPSDSPSTFNTKAFTLLGDLNDWTTEANSLASTVNSNASSASSSASTATTQASNAATSASNASTSASNASSSASAASTSASNASTSATNASNSAIAAAASAASIDPSALPSIRPALLLDFARSRAVDGRITFTRTGTATRTNQNGVLELVASGVPRIDYDPVTLACKGFLIEESRTNLVLNSTIDGVNLATQSVTVTAVAHTLSFYGTGTVTLSGVSTSGPLVGSAAYPTRSTLTFTPTAGTLTLTVTGTVQYCQLEVGSFATSWVPTAGAQVTRAADVASMTGANFSNWYRQSEGAFVAGGDATFSSSNYPVLLDVDDGTANNIIYLSTRGSTTEGRMEAVVGGVSQVASNSTTVASGATFAEAVAYKLNDYALSVKGNTAVADTSATVPTVDRLRIGCERGTGNFVNGHIARIAYYPQRLTNAELQALSL